MNYQLVFKQPQRPPEPPSPRLLEMRATSSHCVESEQSIHQHHSWTVGGTCKRCGVNAFTSAPVPPLEMHNEEPDR